MGDRTSRQKDRGTGEKGDGWIGEQNCGTMRAEGWRDSGDGKNWDTGGQGD